MPYIGNSQVAGVHQNNFKILDDISSYTETFDGSSSSVVNTTNNTITVSQHRFYHGQRVTYNNGGGSNIGGLTSGTVYYAVADSHSTIKLATSLANALINQVINISSVGSGTSHTLNNSFDGVNTKFKLTHSGGNGVNLTNASHATVAINNVVQRPNLNDTSFTEGFAIEGGKNIVFKIAPSPTDTFWGNTIAESVGTFDTTDHVIDSFTADGTTTNFSLSKNPPSIRDIHITLDGVTQHTSAFSLHGNVLIFSTAPTNGTAIQVKHMGFVGASISGVTGFYGRTGNVALQDSDTLRGDGSLITGIDASIAGINTAGISTFFNVGIGGTVGIGSHVHIAKEAYLGFGDDASSISGLRIKNTNINGYDRSSIMSKDLMSLQTILGPTITLNNGSYGNPTYKFLSFTETDNFYIKTTGSGTNAKIIETDTAKVKLNYLGNTKLQTSGIGITVTGEADINGNLSVAGVSTFASDVNVAENIIHTGDTDTKINFPSAGNIITLHTNGEERFRIGQNGSVGLGTNNPEARVDIYDDNTSIAGLLQLSQQGTGDASINFQIKGAQEWTIGADNSDDDKFKISSAAALGSASGGDAVIITTAGNVSIVKDFDVDGHTNLDNVSIAGVSTIGGDIKFTLGGGIFADSSDGNDNLVNQISGGGGGGTSRGGSVITFGNEFSTLSQGGQIQLKAGNVSTGDIIFNTGDTERLRISSAGITTFYGDDDKDNFTVDAAGGTQFTIHQDATDGEVSIRAQDGTGNNYAKYMTFFTEGGSGPTERLRINSDGSANFTNSLSAANYGGLKAEDGLVNVGGLNGDFNVDLGTDGHVYTAAAATAGNYTPNFRHSTTTTLASKMNTGDVVSSTIIVQSSSHYCTSTIKIDGSSKTVKWVGGSAPSAANGSGYDIYSFTIVKVNNTPTYIVIGNAISAA